MVGRSHEKQKRKGLGAGFDSQRYKLLSSHELAGAASQTANDTFASAIIQRVFVLLCRRERADRTLENESGSEYNRSKRPTEIA